MLLINLMLEAHCVQVFYASLLFVYVLGAFGGFGMLGAVLVQPEACRKTFAAQVGTWYQPNWYHCRAHCLRG